MAERQDWPNVATIYIFLRVTLTRKLSESADFNVLAHQARTLNDNVVALSLLLLVALCGCSGSGVSAASAGRTATTITLASNPMTLSYGAATTLTATLSSNSATGPISFLDGANILATMNAANGSASFNATSFGGGTHSLTAVYTGDSNFTGATSAVTVVTVTPAPVIAQITALPGAVTFGGSVAMTTALSNAAATGTVKFMDGANLVGTAPISNGVATFSSSSLAVGTHKITGVYSGDANFASTTTTNPATVVVNPMLSTVTYQAYTAFGDSVTMDWAVTRGTVTQTALTNNVATITLVNSAYATIPKVGDTIGSIAGTSNGSGIFNVAAETPITAVGGGFTGLTTYNGETGTVTGTISFALTHANVAAASENGSLYALSYVRRIGDLLHVTANDQGVAATECADMATPIFSTAVSATIPTLYTNSTGINDLGGLSGTSSRNATTAPAQFANCIEAEDIFLATPASQIVLAKNAAAGAAGWATSTLKDPWIPSTDLGGGLAPSFEMMSDTNGANFTATVSGTAIAVGYEITPSSTGTASVSVDGGTPATITAVPTCLSAANEAVSLVRAGNTVTATGSISGLGVNAGVLVQGASDPSFNGSFNVVTLGPTTATWIQNATDSTATAKLGYNDCNMSRPDDFARTFSPQVLLVTGLKAGSHSVKIQVTSATGPGNYVFVDYLAGNQGLSPAGTPTVASVGLERTENRLYPDSVTFSWDSAIRGVVNSLSSQGWSVVFADVRAQQNALNGGNIGPYMYAEYGATGTFASGSTTVTGVSSTITALMKTGDPIDDGGVYVPAGSTVNTIGTTSFTFTPPAGAAGAIGSGTDFFNLFDIGVHPNNQGQILYYVPAIYQVVNATP